MEGGIPEPREPPLARMAGQPGRATAAATRPCTPASHLHVGGHVLEDGGEPQQDQHDGEPGDHLRQRRPCAHRVVDSGAREGAGGGVAAGTERAGRGLVSAGGTRGGQRQRRRLGTQQRHAPTTPRRRHARVEHGAGNVCDAQAAQLLRAVQAVVILLGKGLCDGHRLADVDEADEQGQGDDLAHVVQGEPPRDGDRGQAWRGAGRRGGWVGQGRWRWVRAVRWRRPPGGPAAAHPWGFCPRA